jgi:adenosylcobinamide kinase/adenosylcobinamide-phosphate guanylyltransferase
MILGGRSVLPDTAAPPPPKTALGCLSLVLGGARSGKSRHAERLIEALDRPALYIATAEARDAEMRERIAAHRARRGTRWSTLEAPLDLAAVLAAERKRPILVDCLTLWLSNVMLAERDAAGEIAGLLDTLSAHPGPVVVVANEVGLGIVPENALARDFRDHAGRLNQQVAALAGHVVFLAAGLPLTLKGA